LRGAPVTEAILQPGGARVRLRRLATRRGRSQRRRIGAPAREQRYACLSRAFFTSLSGLSRIFTGGVHSAFGIRYMFLKILICRAEVYFLL
jgi:hypothetical protein